MADIDAARNNPVKQFFDELGDVHAGMLGVEGSGLHNQPMAPQIDRDGHTIWFYTSRDAALVKAVTPGAKAHFIVIGEDHDYHACVCGPIETSTDPEIVEKFWNPVVAAWYPDGKTDPNLVMLKLTLQDGQAWASTDSNLRFGWEIAKANVTDERPNIGVVADLRF